MGRFFKNRPRVGAPISLAGIARGLDKIDYALSNLRVENGRVIWSQLGAPTLLFGDDGCGSIPESDATDSSYPYGPRWNFGITFSGVDLIVWSGVLYHGDREVVWDGPGGLLQVEGLTDGQVVFIRYRMDGFFLGKLDFVAKSIPVPYPGGHWAREAGYVLRRLLTVSVSDGTARMSKWWGGGLESGLMGDME